MNQTTNYIDLASNSITSYPVLFTGEGTSVVIAFANKLQAIASAQNAMARAMTAIPLFIPGDSNGS